MQEVIYNTNDVLKPNTTFEQPKFEPYTLVSENDIILGSKISKFDFSDHKIDPSEIASRLVETARLHKIFGIAANQVGLRYDVFVAGNDDNYVAFFNPEIIAYSGDITSTQEIDISNMGLILSVKRPNSITIQFQDYNGQQQFVKFDGLTARIIQQNVDRLNGIDFKSLVSPLALKRAEKAREKRVKKVMHNFAFG
jgi:peptide deformylase